MVELNATIFIIMFIFLALVITMNFMFYKPIFRIMDERKELIESNISQAKKMEEEARILLENYEKRLIEAKQKAVALVNEGKQKALDQQKEAISNARKEMEKSLEELKVQLDAEKEEARKKLRETVKLLAVLIAQKVLGRSIEEERV